MGGKFCVIFVILISVTLGFTQKNCPVPVVSNKWGAYIQQVTEPFEYIQAPFWDHRTQLLYFVDVHKGLAYSLDPVTNQINYVHFDGDLAPIVPTTVLNKFVIGNNNSIVSFYWDGRNSSEVQNVTILSTVSPEKPGSRFLDGKADKYGRLWWGTIGFENITEFRFNEGSLYLIDKRNHLNPVIEITPVNVSNGPVWSSDNTKLYFSDGLSRKIFAYDFDLEKAEISNEQVIFDYNDYSLGGYPGGLTIDEDGNLFVASFNGGEVLKVSPAAGDLLQRIAIPARRVTSCMFGGRGSDVLFVTTSRFRLTDLEYTYEPAAGAVFAVSGLGTRGRTMYFADEF